MTRFRTWLADLVTGGDYSRLVVRDAGFTAISEAFIRRSDASWETIIRLEDALDDIAEMETPNANATVKRMARRAREARG